MLGAHVNRLVELLGYNITARAWKEGLLIKPEGLKCVQNEFIVEETIFRTSSVLEHHQSDQ